MPMPRSRPHSSKLANCTTTAAAAADFDIFRSNIGARECLENGKEKFRTRVDAPAVIPETGEDRTKMGEFRGKGTKLRSQINQGEEGGDCADETRHARDDVLLQFLRRLSPTVKPAADHCAPHALPLPLTRTVKCV